MSEAAWHRLTDQLHDARNRLVELEEPGVVDITKCLQPISVAIQLVVLVAVVVLIRGC